MKRDPDRDMMFHPKGPVVRGGGGPDPADSGVLATLGAYLATIARAFGAGRPSQAVLSAL